MFSELRLELRDIQSASWCELSRLSVRLCECQRDADEAAVPGVPNSRPSQELGYGICADNDQDSG